MKQTIYILLKRIYNYFRFTLIASGLKICNSGSSLNINKFVIGSSNQMFVGKGGCMRDLTIHVVGNGNKIIIGDNVRMFSGCSIWIEGNDIEVIIGNNCTFNHSNHINAQENGTKIVIGEDCMISNNVHIRTSDSHPIYDKNSGLRINLPKDVFIGKHVWIAPKSSIYKGVIVGEGAIIASNSLVTHAVKAYSLVAGIPAKIVKENIFWTRENIINVGS